MILNIKYLNNFDRHENYELTTQSVQTNKYSAELAECDFQSQFFEIFN
jgi:hypothetical protein